MESELLAKYLAKECSRKEQAQVEEWIARDEKNKKLMSSFENIWRIAKEESYLYQHMFNSEIDWATLKSRIEDNFPEKELSLHKKSKMSQYKSAWSVALRVAAVFLAAILLGVLSYQNFYTQPAEIVEPVLREISMSKGHRGNITLSDGTKVHINSDSKIKIPSVFENDKRVIHLEGQAYLDVVKNPNKPFIVHANGATVLVLGTSFSVKSYPGEKTIETVVEEGMVSLRAEGEKFENGVILTAGKLGRLNTIDKEITTHEVEDMDLYLSWKKGYLKFHETAMSEVAKQLERKYDIDIEFNSEDIEDLHLTAELKSRSMENVLEVISMSLNLQYSVKNDKVIFSH